MRIVNLFVHHPISFEELWVRSEVVRLQSGAVRIASIPDLIHLKRLVGRPQDLADLEKLEQIQKFKRQQEGG